MRNLAGRILALANAGRWALFGAFVLAGGLFLATALDRAPVVAFASIMGRLGQATYRPGDTVYGYWVVTALRACDGTAERSLTIKTGDGGTWTYWLPAVPVKLSYYADHLPGMVSYSISAFTLPPDAPAGRAFYRHVDSFVCGRPGHLVFPIIQPYPLLEFTVEPAR